ncbi:MAG: hypothetical protein WA478_15720, partial [Pseudolabrys sp.]
MTVVDIDRQLTLCRATLPTAERHPKLSAAYPENPQWWHLKNVRGGRDPNSAISPGLWCKNNGGMSADDEQQCSG